MGKFNSQYDEEVFEEEPPEIIEDESEIVPEDGVMPSLSYDEEPIKTGCSSVTPDTLSALPFIVLFMASLFRREQKEK